MDIEREEQRERDRRFMKALGLKMEMDIPCPGDCLDEEFYEFEERQLTGIGDIPLSSDDPLNVPRGVRSEIRGSVECESGALHAQTVTCELTLPTKAEIEIRLQRR